MKTFTKILAAGVSAVALAAVAAPSQAAVYIAYDIGAGVVELTPGGIVDGPFVLSPGPLGGFDTVILTGNVPALPSLLHTQNVQVNSNGAPASLTLYVTRTDVASPAPLFGYVSTFTSNNSRAGFQVTEQTLVDTNNGKYGGELLTTANFNSDGAQSLNNVYHGTVAASNNPFYSVTHVYSITDVGGSNGSSSPSITLRAAVPEPGTWALMILGFGGAGAMIRRRKLALAV